MGSSFATDQYSPAYSRSVAIFGPRRCVNRRHHLSTLLSTLSAVTDRSCRSFDTGVVFRFVQLTIICSEGFISQLVDSLSNFKAARIYIKEDHKSSAVMEYWQYQVIAPIPVLPFN